MRFLGIRGHSTCNAYTIVVIVVKKEGDKGAVGRGVLSVREIGGADLICVVGPFHAEAMLCDPSDSSTDARF